MANMDRDQLGELLSSYVDNELDDRERAYVERLLESDEDVRRWYESLTRTVTSVQQLPRHRAPDSLAPDLQEQLERIALLDDESSQISPTTVRFPWFSVLSAAAVLLAAALVGITQYPEWFSPKRRADQLAMAPKAAPSGALREKGEEEKSPGRDTTDLSTKLAAGADIEAIRTHSFNNETVRLAVELKDRKTQTLAMNRVISFLTGEHVMNLASARADSANLAQSAFFIKGKDGVNYDDGGERQVLVRIPVDELDALLDEVAVEAVEAKRVTFAAGSLRYEGLDSARRMLRPLREELQKEQVADASWSREEGTLARRGRGSTKGKQDKDHGQQDDLTRELLKTLDISPDVAAEAEKKDRADNGRDVDADEATAKTANRFAMIKENRASPASSAALADEAAEPTAGAEKPAVQTNTGMAVVPPSLDSSSAIEADVAHAEVPGHESPRPASACFVTLVLEFTTPQAEKPATGPAEPGTANPPAKQPPGKTR